MLSPAARYAVAALPIGLATVFIPDHSPRALVFFLLSHSIIGLALFALNPTVRASLRGLFGYAAGTAVSLVGAALVALFPPGVELASLVAIIWSLIWLTHWWIFRSPLLQTLIGQRDRLIQLAITGLVTVALVLSFGDPVASSGFAGVYLFAAGLHLAIVAASPRVG